MISCFFLFFSQPSYSLVRHPFSINGKPLPDTPAKPEDLFAVIELSGTQYKVTLVRTLIVIVVIVIVFFSTSNSCCICSLLFVID